MNQCKIENIDEIINKIGDFLYESELDVNSKNIEEYVKAEIPEIGDFSLKTYASENEFKNKLEKTLDDFGYNINEIIELEKDFNVLTKNDVSANFKSITIKDMFHTMPLINSLFEQFVNGKIIIAAIIGSKDSNKYVSTDSELNDNIIAFKNELYESIKNYLINKNELSSTLELSPLYGKNGEVLNYDQYRLVMRKLDAHFFNSGDNLIKTYFNKSIPNLDIKNTDKDKINAYNYGIILNNFDSVISVYFKNIIDVNYTKYNNLQNVTEGFKYSLNIKGINLEYWLNDGHDAEGSETNESNLMKLLPTSIPLRNKKGELTGIYGELSYFYALAAKVSDYEILNGVRLKKQKNSNFKYFNENPNEGLNYYLDLVLDPKVDPSIKAHFSDNYDFMLSLREYLNNPDLNIREKEKNSKSGIVDIFAQVINNNFGTSYTKADASNKYVIQRMYAQNFNNISVQNSVFSKMFSNSTNTEMYDIKSNYDTIAKLFENVDENMNIKDISKTLKGKIGGYIGSRTGIFLSSEKVDDLIEDLIKFNKKEETIKVLDFVNKLKSLIVAVSSDFSTMRTNIENGVVTQRFSRGDVEISNHVKNTISNELFKALNNAYLMNVNVKPVMTVKDSSGNNLPSFKIANLTHKDTELLEEQRLIEESKGEDIIFQSLLLGETPLILGTATKLEITHDKISKKADKITLSENFTFDFQFGFLENLINNNRFDFQIGNYSDKVSILTKIVNGDFKLEGSDTLLIEEKIDKILNTVRIQGANYYKSAIISVIKDYSEILGIELSTKSLNDINKSIEVINEKLKTINPRNLSKIASDKKIKFTEELHYSSYQGQLALNQVLIDNYKIFNNSELFSEFVKRKEDSFINSFKQYNKKLLEGTKIQFVGGNENIPNYLKKLGLTYKDFNFKRQPKDNEDYTDLVINGKLNPMLQKWLWLTNLVRNEYLFISTKGEYMHPHKNKSLSIRSGEINKEYFDIYDLEVTGRLNNMGKRNVINTSLLESPIRKSKLGVPEQVNHATIDDSKDKLYTILGETHNQDVHDGSSFINYLYSKMIDNSYPGKSYEGTKKQFATFVTEFGVTLKKDAESVITNDKIRNSINSEIKFIDKQKQMLGLPIEKDDINDYSFRKSFNDEFYFNYFGRRSKITALYIKGKEKKYVMNVALYKNGVWEHKLEPVVGNFESLFDLWKLFGGAYSTDADGNFNEGSNELLYDIITTPDKNGNYPLKDKMIHIISSASAIKAGAVNVNSKESWKSDSSLAYATFNNRFMGPQLDPGHNSDDSEIKEVTQVISALAQNPETAYLAQEAYEDIAKVIKESMSIYKKYLNRPDSKELYNYLAQRFVKSIENAKGADIAKILIHNFKNDENIPFSNQNFYESFVKDIITNMNKDFITRYYSGIGVVLIPSHGIIQLYDVPIKNKLDQIIGYRVATQADLAKEALNTYYYNKYPGAVINSNEDIINNYINNKLQDIDISWDKVQLGDTVKVDENVITLNTPELYYKFKAEKFKNVKKVLNKPRDLKPTLHTFSVEGRTMNTFDLLPVRLKFRFKNGTLTEEDKFILNAFISKFKININDDQLIDKYLTRWLQRTLEVLDHGKLIDQLESTSTFINRDKKGNIIGIDLERYFSNDTLLNNLIDVKDHYLSDDNSKFISDYNFQEAELIMGDIYKSRFKRNFNDSMYEIDSKDFEYFSEKIEKDFEKDDTEADFKLNIKGMNNPIYIKYVDKMPGNDQNIRIISEYTQNEGKIERKYVRKNDFDETLYTIPDLRTTRVAIIDNKEFILVLNSDKHLDDNLSRLLNSFKNNIKSFIPLLNNSGSDEINKTTFNKFIEYSEYPFDKFDKLDNSWYIRNAKEISLELGKRMFASWKKSHNFIAARIPAQSMQSFMPMRNVAYHNTLTNDAYVSVYQILLQGSDFKITLESL